MNVSEIKTYDIANGAGVRVTIFVSGCRHHCKDCFNEVAWPFNSGVPFNADEVVKLLGDPYVDGLSVLGGEPLEPENQEALAPFLEEVKETYPDKDIWMWTGFTYDNLEDSRANTEYLERILSCVDVLVDGPFIEGLKDITARFYGSLNQRLIDLQKTRKAGRIILWDDGPVYSKRSWN